MLKVVFVGNAGVGKTTLLNRLIGNTFNENIPTINATNFRMTQNVGDHEWTFVLWDTAGQERFRSLVPMFFRGAHYIFLIFDLSDRQSFEDLSKWMELVREYSVELAVILIGNKADLEPAVEMDAIEAYQQEINAPIYFLVSAYTSEGINFLLPFIAQHAQEAEQGATKGDAPSGKPQNETEGCC
jgi:small GTP-binding protein